MFVMRTPTPGNGAGVRFAYGPVSRARQGGQAGWPGPCRSRGLAAGFSAIVIGGPQRLGALHQLLVESFELRLEDDLVGLLANRELLEDGQIEQAALGLAGQVIGPLVGVDQ
jgi:hypothetical protein